MITFNINCDEFSTKNEVAETLREIANRIDEGYNGGITNNGTTWGIDGKDEELEESRFLRIGQRVYYYDPFYSDGSGYGVVQLIHFQANDNEFFSDTIVTLKMENSGIEIEVNGEYIYIIDEKKSAEMGEIVCFEHLDNDYDYYMPSNDCHYMNGEL